MAKKHNVSVEDEYDSFYEEAVLEQEEAFRHKNAKAQQKPKGKHKGHQSKHMSHAERWSSVEEDYLNSLTATEDIPAPRPKTRMLGSARMVAEKNNEPVMSPRPTQPATPQPQQNKFTFGPNTHEIKGNMIDFDRVADIQKVENEYNGRHTFGIKFLFLGKKGLFRIAWFNQNVKERDRVYDVEYMYWTTLESFLTRK